VLQDVPHHHGVEARTVEGSGFLDVAEERGHAEAPGVLDRVAVDLQAHGPYAAAV
jgi:hypothetical protein